jgi:hypothetical protein
MQVRSPLLDTLYARLMRCGNLACTGKSFTEHSNIPDLRPDPADPRVEWEQAERRHASRKPHLRLVLGLTDVLVEFGDQRRVGNGLAA